MRTLGFDKPLYILPFDPLVDGRAKKVTRDAAVAEIARRYQEFVEIFETREEVVPA